MLIINTDGHFDQLVCIAGGGSGGQDSRFVIGGTRRSETAMFLRFVLEPMSIIPFSSTLFQPL